MADLRAQIAANEKGAEELKPTIEQFGADIVASYMRHAVTDRHKRAGFDRRNGASFR
jgi:N-methylhydantoinase B/oxoprolinase/acetone carboxylase alpha subunit